MESGQPQRRNWHAARLVFLTPQSRPRSYPRRLTGITCIKMALRLFLIFVLQISSKFCCSGFHLRFILFHFILKFSCKHFHKAAIHSTVPRSKRVLWIKTIMRLRCSCIISVLYSYIYIYIYIQVYCSLRSLTLVVRTNTNQLFTNKQYRHKYTINKHKYCIVFPSISP